MGCGLSRFAPDPESPAFKNHERRKQWIKDERDRTAEKKARRPERLQKVEEAKAARRREYDAYQERKRLAAKAN